MKLEKLKKDLENYKEDILTRNIEAFSLEVIKVWSLEKWTEELMNTLSFSFTDVLESFVEENKEESCFKEIIDNGKFYGDTEKYINYVCDSWKREYPFSNREPKEFFQVLTNLSKELIKDISGLN